MEWIRRLPAENRCYSRRIRDSHGSLAVQIEIPEKAQVSTCQDNGLFYLSEGQYMLLPLHTAEVE